MVQGSIGNADRDGGGKKDICEAGTRRISVLGELGRGEEGPVSSSVDVTPAACNSPDDSARGLSGNRSLICTDLSRGI